MLVYFVTQPSRLPAYMISDIVHVSKTLYRRILSFQKYRALSRNLETRFVTSFSGCRIVRTQPRLFGGSAKRVATSFSADADLLRLLHFTVGFYMFGTSGGIVAFKRVRVELSLQLSSACAVIPITRNFLKFSCRLILSLLPFWKQRICEYMQVS